MNATAIRATLFDISFGSTGSQGRALHTLPCRQREPVRLHDIGSILPRSDSLLAGGAKEELLREALKRLCNAWDRRLVQLMDRYFAFLHRRIEAARPQIEKQLAHYEGLYAAEDVLFSAPAILPRARIEQQNVRDIPVPGLMWSGERLTALFDGKVGETPRRSRERTERLEIAGIAIRMIEPQTSAAGDDTFFTTLLGPTLARFFETEPLPCAPLPPDLAPEFLQAARHASTRV